jgi:hypothetical protein
MRHQVEASVATTAESYSVKRASAKAPISTHPAFPAIAALWFAALLGIGSLVLPVALIGRFVEISGLAKVFPSVAPPLGFTARAGIALVGAIAGSLTGLVLARKVAESHASEAPARALKFEQARECRPIQVHDELDEEGLGSVSGPPAPTKRRALAMAEDNARSTYLQTVPLPGMAAGATAAFAEPVEAPSPLVEAPEEAEAEPLELAAFADLEALDEEEAPETAPDDALEALRSRIHTPVEPSLLQDQPMTTDRPGADIPEDFEPARDAADPLPFAPPSLRRGESVSFDEDEEVHTAAGETSPPHLSIIEDSAEFEDAGDDRPLAELGLVQLAARLGASLARRKVLLASPPSIPAAAQVPPLPAAEDFEAAEAEDAARAIADFFGPAQAAQPIADAFDGEPDAAAVAVPASLREWSLEGDDDGDEDAIAQSFSLPLGKPGVTAARGDDDDSAEAEEHAEEGDYSSLLAMKNPFAQQQEFVRVEEPADDDAVIEPIVTFPSPSPEHAAQPEPAQADTLGPRPFDPPQIRGKTAISPTAVPESRDPGDAERNLRAALATLQRMSGAA